MVFKKERLGDIMKKILKINAMIILLFSSLLTYFTFKNNDTSYWNEWGNTNMSREFYIRNTGYSGEDMYVLLTTLAEEENVNLVKTDYLEEKDSTKIVKSIYLTDETDDLFQENTISNHIFVKDKESNAYLSTKDTEDEEQKGEVFDPFDDDHVEFWSLKRFQKERGNLDGVYMVRSTNSDAINAFIDEFSKRSGIDMEELTTQKTFSGTIKSPIETISMIVIIIGLLLFALLSVYYAVNNIKKIGVMKLNGYSNTDVWKAMILDVMTTIVLAVMLLDMIMLAMLKNLTKDFMIYLIITQAIFICALLMLSLIVYFIIKRNTISNLIKNKKPIKLITSITYLIKSVMLFVMISLIAFMSSGFQDIQAEYERLKQWNDVGDLAVLVNVNIGNDQASFSQGKMDLENDFIQYYHNLNQQGAIYVSVNEFVPHVLFKTEWNERNQTFDYVDYFDPDAVPQDYSNINFLVNPNYVKEYPIKDMNGKVIEVSEEDERTILIPNTMANQKESLISIYQAKYQDGLLSDSRKMNTVHVQQNVIVKAIIYQSDPNGYFTFNEDFKETNYLAYDPIFEVAPEHKMTQSEKGNIQVQGLKSPLKLNLKGMTSKEYNQTISDETASYHLNDNELRYMTIKEVFGNEIESLKLSCQQYLIGMIICIIAMILITIQMAQMVLEIDKKKYCIQKLNGYRFIDRYQTIVIANSVLELGIGLLALVIAPSLMQISVGAIVYLVLIPVLLLDFILVSCLLRYYENKNLSQMVKGE